MNPHLPPISTMWSQAGPAQANYPHDEAQNGHRTLGPATHTFVWRDQPPHQAFDEIQPASPLIRTRLTFDDADDTDADVQPAGPSSKVPSGQDRDVVADVALASASNISSYRDQEAARRSTGKRLFSPGCAVQLKRRFVSASGHEVCDATSQANTPPKRTSTPQRGSHLQLNSSTDAMSSAQRKCPGKSPGSATSLRSVSVKTNSVQRSRTSQTPSNTRNGRSGKTPDSYQRGRSRKTPTSPRSRRRSRTPGSGKRRGRNEQSNPTPEQPSSRRIIFNMHKKRKPQHWRFIQLVCRDDYSHIPLDVLRSEHAKRVFCHKCGVEIAFEKSNTAHVTKHMKTRHPKELREATKEEESRKRNRIQVLVHTKPNKLPETSDYQEAATVEEQARADDFAAIWVA